MRSILRPTTNNKSFVARERGVQLRWLLTGIVLLIAALAYVFLGAYPQDMGDAHGLLSKVVIIALLLSFLLVLTVPSIYSRLRGATLASEEGVYVEFQGQRTRNLKDADALWLHVQDVHAVPCLPVQQ